jgi:hypothetical protein
VFDRHSHFAWFLLVVPAAFVRLAQAAGAFLWRFEPSFGEIAFQNACS